MLNLLRNLFLRPTPVQAKAKVEIYTWKSCPYCIQAKRLLDKKGVSYQEYAIDGDEEARDKMSERAEGRRTVPQIFVNGSGIGGCDELHELERRSALDPLLLEAPAEK
jgi:glutaredoxin 3